MHSAVITEPRRSVFAVLDMGSTKIVCLVVRVNNEGVPEILGVGHKTSEGINGGAIANKHSAGSAILSSIDLAEQVSAQTISQVYVSVAGCGVRSFCVSNEVSSNVREISGRDIGRVMLKTYEKFRGEDIVIHNVPLAYHLDDLNNVVDLTGLYGKQLRADVHAVTVSKTALYNIENSITVSNLSMGGCVAESYASGMACLTDDERELGTLIIDMGGHYTSMGFFYKGKFVHADSIPFGGIHITRDVAYGICASIRDAERIKMLHGSAIQTPADRNYSIEIENMDGETQCVTKLDIANIIRPRVEEILEFVRCCIDEHKDVVSKVVITGGCSKLGGIREVAGAVLGRQVRIGTPFHMKGMWQEYGGRPEFSAAVGTAMLIARTFSGSAQLRKQHRTHSSVEKVLRWIITKVET